VIFDGEFDHLGAIMRMVDSPDLGSVLRDRLANVSFTAVTIDKWNHRPKVLDN